MNMDSEMNIYKAVAIFSDIDNESISDHDKSVAIYIVASRDRTFEVKKDAMMKVIRWLWQRCFRVKKEDRKP